MNELDHKLIRLHDSLMVMRNLGMNIPEIILWNKPDDIVNNQLAAKACNMILTHKIELVLPGIKGYGNLKANEFSDYIYNDYMGNGLLVLKASTSTPLVSGTCVPGPYYNRIQIADSEHAIIWSYNYEMPFPIGLRKAVLELNKYVQRGRQELDGMRIMWTFHPRGEGLLRDKIVLWGMYI